MAPASGTLPASLMGELLACLRQVELSGFAMPKHRYPSAGNLYPVQVYVLVKEGRVEGVPAGVYYHHPREHRLVRISGDAGLESALSAGSEPLADSGDFLLFLIAQRDAIRPVYAELSDDLALLEAGYMAHLLESGAAPLSIALRLLPELDFTGLEDRFALDESHVLLCALLGGRADVAACGAPTAAGTGSGPLRLVAAGGRGATSFQPELTGEVETLMFKLRQPGLRPCADAEPRVELAGPALDEAETARYMTRRTYREFAKEAVSAAELTSLLSASLESLSAPVGNEVLVTAKDGRVAGLPAGVYRFAPDERRLDLLSAGDPLSAGLHIPPNRPVFAQAAFSILLVSPEGSPPGDAGRTLATFQAGAFGQALMETAPAFRLGLCPIGSLEFAPVRHLLGLPETCDLLHSLVGGRLPSEERKPSRDRADELANEIRTYLEGQLPEYMVPASIFTVDELPLSSNGKVNRKALAARLQVTTEAAAVFVAPRTEMEQLVVAVWTEVLDAQRIGIDDNFFDLGGHSVEVVRVHRRLQELLGSDLPVIKLFSNPTPRLLAETLSRDRVEGVLSLQQDRERAQARRAARHRRRRGMEAPAAGETPDE